MMDIRQWLVSKLDPERQRANPVANQIIQPWSALSGIGDNWAPRAYGDYQSKSVPVYAAIKLRAEAVSRPPLLVYRETTRGGETVSEQVERDHPAQALVNKVNKFWTRGELWRATETYLGLWGSAYWAIERDSAGVPVEIWPLRPDYVKVIPSREDYIKGYLFSTGSGSQPRAFAPDEIVRFRYFNAMSEFTGLSPIAPVRLSADMALDAMRANRGAQVNDQTPGLMLTTEDTPTDDEVKEFYARWETRFKGAGNTARPALLSAGMKPQRLGLTPQEMQQIETLRWSLADVARVYNVPLTMLHELTRATYNNTITMRQSFWEDCIVPQLIWYTEALQEYLLPMFDEDLTVQFDLSQIEALKENADKVTERRVKYVSTGIMTPNEARDEMGLDAIDQPGADELQLPGGGLMDLPALSAPVGRQLPRQLRSMPWEEVAREVERDFLRALKPREAAFRVLMDGLFQRQTKDMLSRLGDQRSLMATWKDSSIIRYLASGRAETGQTGGLELFNPQEWDEVFAELGGPVVRSGLADAARRVNQQFHLGIAFDVDRPITQRWIQDRVAFWSARVNDTTANLVTGLVDKANAEGWSIPQLSEGIDDLGVANRGARAPTIARTEMVSAQNEGHLQAYDQAEVEGKQWLTSIDGRERESHAEAHMQIRRLREDFDVGGEKLRAPGQGGSAGEVINCRCVALPHFEASDGQ